MATIKENLMDLFELDKMPPEKATEMIDRLSKMIFQAVLMKALPLLSEKDLEGYEKIVDAKEGPEVLFKYLGEKIPNFENMIQEESEILRQELAGEFKSAGI